MVEIKKLPPGEAIGARDLQNWASDRLANRSQSFGRLTGNSTVETFCPRCRNVAHIAFKKDAAKKIVFNCIRCGAENIKVKKPKRLRKKWKRRIV